MRSGRSSRHRLRESDLIIRRVGRRHVAGPVEDHAEEDRVTPRIVQRVANYHPLLDLGVGESDAAPGREIGTAPLEIANHLTISEIRRRGSNTDRRGPRGTGLSANGEGDAACRVDEPGDVIRGGW